MIELYDSMREYQEDWTKLQKRFEEFWGFCRKVLNSGGAARVDMVISEINDGGFTVEFCGRRLQVALSASAVPERQGMLQGHIQFSTTTQLEPDVILSVKKVVFQCSGLSDVSNNGYAVRIDSEEAACFILMLAVENCLRQLP